MDAAEKVLNALKKSKDPLNAGKIVEITKLDRKEVDKAMKQLKDSGQIVSPVRCFWTAK
jgi:DNA-binding transcriptional regulator GbsR (MarR family)